MVAAAVVGRLVDDHSMLAALGDETRALCVLKSNIQGFAPSNHKVDANRGPSAGSGRKSSISKRIGCEPPARLRQDAKLRQMAQVQSAPERGYTTQSNSRIAASRTTPFRARLPVAPIATESASDRLISGFAARTPNS